MRVVFLRCGLEARGKRRHERITSEDQITIGLDEIVGSIAFNANVSGANGECVVEREVRADRPIPSFAVIGEGQEAISVTNVTIECDRRVWNANADICVEVQVVGASK